MDPAGHKVYKKTTNYAHPDSTFPVCFMYLGIASIACYVTEVGDTEDPVEVGFVKGSSYVVPNGFTCCSVVKYQEDGVMKKTFMELKCKKKSGDSNKTKMTARCVNGFGHLYSCVHTKGSDDGKNLGTIVRKLRVKLLKTWNKAPNSIACEKRLSVFSRCMMNHPNFYDMLREAKKGADDKIEVQTEWLETSGYYVKWPKDRVYRTLLQTRNRRVSPEKKEKEVATPEKKKKASLPGKKRKAASQAPPKPVKIVRIA